MYVHSPQIVDIVFDPKIEKKNLFASNFEFILIFKLAAIIT